jgi:N,N-dimethylformamidase beta subunit-like protein
MSAVRISLLRGIGLLLLVLAASGADSPRSATPALTGLAVTNGDSPFAGDRRLLTTISPNGDGFRDRAEIHFRLRRVASVTVVVNWTKARLYPIFRRRDRFGPGLHTVVWAPPASILPRTYLVRLFVRDRRGRTWTYGARSPSRGGQTAPVVRVQGVDAAFLRESYRPGATARLRVATDADRLEVQLFHSGPEYVPRQPPASMSGLPAGDPVELPWRWKRGSHVLPVKIGDVPSGLYFAKLTASDGRVGFAPFVVRPRILGAAARVAVVLPTNTWQAYNFQDADGNGWGDTWYAGPSAAPATLRVPLHRPFLDRGVPPHFVQYDLAFLHWAAWWDHPADYLADSDLERLGSGGQLARLYRLIVFPGHEEYVTGHVYRLVRRFRNLGGNLMFLSADNFYWRVARRGNVIERTSSWRELGRPEGALIGAQYAGYDGGARLGPYVVRRAGRARWLFRGTGLENGSRFGSFGVEIDAKGPASPRQTIVLADRRRLFGGRAAQMTYYRTPAGAEVFDFGAFTLAGVATQPPMRQLLENLWARLSRP